MANSFFAKTLSEEGVADNYLTKPPRKIGLETIIIKWLRERLETMSEMPDTSQVCYDEIIPHTPPVPTLVVTDTTAPHEYGVDISVFNSAQEALGAKLPTILSFYLGDAESCINLIAQSLDQGDPSSAIVPAHTLKNSCCQFGIIALADLAAQAEAIAKLEAGDKAKRLAILLPEMRSALNKVRPFFKSAGTF